MREIKFRGYDSTKWYYGDLEYNKKNDVARIHTYKDDGSYDKQYTVDPNTVGQFTGLCDKNGKEIYEGDIIYSEFSDKSNCHCLVGWNDEEAHFGLMDEYAFRSEQKGYDFPKFDSLVLLNFRNHGTKFEVIGNMYDNPELLNKE